MARLVNGQRPVQQRPVNLLYIQLLTGGTSLHERVTFFTQIPWSIRKNLRAAWWKYDTGPLLLTVANARLTNGGSTGTSDIAGRHADWSWGRAAFRRDIGCMPFKMLRIQPYASWCYQIHTLGDTPFSAPRLPLYHYTLL